MTLIYIIKDSEKEKEEIKGVEVTLHTLDKSIQKITKYTRNTQIMLAFRTMRPLLNRVVVKKAEAITKTKGGIILTSGKEERLNFGTVIAVGPGRHQEDGSIRETLVKVGDQVLLPEYGGAKVILADEQELFIYRDDDIMGTLHDPSEWARWQAPENQLSPKKGTILTNWLTAQVNCHFWDAER